MPSNSTPPATRGPSSAWAGSPAADDDAVLEQLRRVERELAEMRALVERLVERSERRAPARRSRARCDATTDMAHLRALLPCIWETLGRQTTPFGVGDILAFAERDAPLRAAIEKSGLNAHRLGRLLARWVDRPVDYQTVRRHGSRDGVSLWRIEPRGFKAVPVNP